MPTGATKKPEPRKCLICEETFIPKSNRQTYCSTQCRNIRDRIAHREIRRDWKRENGRKNRAKLEEFKLSKGCAKCGYDKHHAALEFNHLDPATKTGNISEKVTIWSQKKIMEEVDKCEVLCAMC